MNKRNKIISVVMTIILTCAFVINNPLSEAALSKFGSSGTEVYNIQRKLSAWGYYSGDIDGVYGSKTVESVKKFQRNNHLTADGVAGPETLAKLGLPQGSTSSGGGTSQSSVVNLLAMAINGEARGEPYSGQVAVGAVILNRVKHPSFPNTVAGVVYQPGAFTAVSDGQINAAMVESCVRAAQDALNGWDPVGGAIYYYNPVTATNQWIRTRTIIARIGKHVFCS